MSIRCGDIASGKQYGVCSRVGTIAITYGRQTAQGNRCQCLCRGARSRRAQWSDYCTRAERRLRELNVGRAVIVASVAAGAWLGANCAEHQRPNPRRSWCALWPALSGVCWWSGGATGHYACPQCARCASKWTESVPVGRHALRRRHEAEHFGAKWRRSSALWPRHCCCCRRKPTLGSARRSATKGLSSGRETWRA